MIKSKVSVVEMDQRTCGERVRMDGVQIEEVDKFKYLGVISDYRK